MIRTATQSTPTLRGALGRSMGWPKAAEAQAGPPCNVPTLRDADQTFVRFVVVAAERAHVRRYWRWAS